MKEETMHDGALMAGSPGPARFAASRLKGRMASMRRLARNLDEEARTAAGLVWRGLGLERRAPLLPLFEEQPVAFRAWKPGKALAPVSIVTPADGAFLHTFFDVCPISASGRYLAVTRLPFEHRAPAPGDIAEICVIDLVARTMRSVYRTCGWALQLGANIQWHPRDDGRLYCNDRAADGRGVGVEIAHLSGTSRRFDAPFYTIDPAGRYMLGPALDLINATQAGYGVPEPLWGRRRLPRGASTGEGIWRTDLETGRSEMFCSIADLVGALPTREILLKGANYLFHTKISPDGERLFQVLRSVDLPDRPGAVRSSIVTLDTDGGNLRLALPHTDWDRGGHHPGWLPDGRHIMMNLVPRSGEPMRFMRFAHDGSALAPVGPWRGSGHPSIEREGRLLVTDAYLNEGFGRPDGEAPLRLIDLDAGVEHELATVDLGPPNLRARRVDPHPVWGRHGRQLVFNGVVGGRRQVMLADLAGFPQA